ncbi:MAG: TPM domain-containing protein [Candidatus Limnocylindrales bacterium]
MIRRALLAVSFASIAFAAAGAVLGQSAGPPYPPPINDVVVYDYANVLTPQTEASATATIVEIEHRVGAEVVVYTQYKPGSDEDSTRVDARALLDQWLVGRAGFFDGLVILINMNRTKCVSGISGNGQVQLYAGDGYKAAFLSGSERQKIFDEDMVPKLARCDIDGSVLVALEKIDANATPEHAQTLQTARVIDAAVGLIGGPLAFVFLISAAAWSWLRYGKDPVYLDDASILMPAPPPDLTAAAGAVIWEGRASRRALTTAMLDLASRGELSFRQESGLLRSKAGIQIHRQPISDPYVERNRRRPLSEAEDYALARLSGMATPSEDFYIEPDDIPKFGQYASKFDDKIERYVTQKGWFREPPANATGRWTGRGWLVIGLGVVSLFGAFNLPSQGLTILGVALLAAGIVILYIARQMPARTMAGAMVYAMLAAYRRTLEKTMAQARSMQQVVAEAKLDWLETPDQAVVWGTALGLQKDVEDVLARSAEDAQAGVMTYNPWLPLWWASSTTSAGPSGGSYGIAPGLFSGSAIPDFGGMMSALGSIGNSPSSSGSGSGGFSGGGSGGGGGGGAGGGF